MLLIVSIFWNMEQNLRCLAHHMHAFMKINGARTPSYFQTLPNLNYWTVSIVLMLNAHCDSLHRIYYSSVISNAKKMKMIIYLQVPRPSTFSTFTLQITYEYFGIFEMYTT